MRGSIFLSLVRDCRTFTHEMFLSHCLIAPPRDSANSLCLPHAYKLIRKTNYAKAFMNIYKTHSGQSPSQHSTDHIELNKSSVYLKDFQAIPNLAILHT